MKIHIYLAKSILSFIIVGLFASGPVASMATITQASQPPSLEQLVKQVIDTLSNEAEFTLWKDASWDKYPLGPGTHQWLILLTDGDGDEIGYLVLNAIQDGGWQLNEYGTGPYPLFGEATFKKRLHANIAKSFEAHHKNWDHAARYYLHSFEAVWAMPLKNGQFEYIDAVTNEAYPAEWVETSLRQYSEQPERAVEDGLPLVNDKLILSSSKTFTEVFDPYERISWLVAEPITLDSLLGNTAPHYVYVTSIFDQNIHIPWPITGMHNWNNFTFLKIETDGISRFIPVSTFQQYGELYPVL